MRVQLSHRVKGIAPDAAARWWSDFQDGHSDHGFIPGHRRRILARRGDSVLMEEETKLLGMRVFLESTTAWIGEREVRFAGRNTFALFDGAYTFEPDPAGTRVDLDANVTLKRPLEWTDVLAKPVVAALLKADLAAHVKDMQKDMKADRQKPGNRRA